VGLDRPKSRCDTFLSFFLFPSLPLIVSLRVSLLLPPVFIAHACTSNSLTQKNTQSAVKCVITIIDGRLFEECQVNFFLIFFSCRTHWVRTTSTSCPYVITRPWSHMGNHLVNLRIEYDCNDTYARAGIRSGNPCNRRLTYRNIFCKTQKRDPYRWNSVLRKDVMRDHET